VLPLDVNPERIEPSESAEMKASFRMGPVVAPGHVVDRAADRAVPRHQRGRAFQEFDTVQVDGLSMTRETKLCGPILIPS